MHFAEQVDQPRVLLRNHDRKLTEQFDEILQAEGVQVKAMGPRAPNRNAVAERWVRGVKGECLDHPAVFGGAHLRDLVWEYLAGYHACRPHPGPGNRPLSSGLPADRFTAHQRRSGAILATTPGRLGFGWSTFLTTTGPDDLRKLNGGQHSSNMNHTPAGAARSEDAPG
jgi:hypothetical protein